MSTDADGETKAATSASATPSGQGQLAVVSIKLPPYWPADPHVWFAQVEAQFATRNVTLDSTKYAYVVSALTPDIAQEVRDILLSPPTENPYKMLKDELIKRTSATEQKRLQQLLNEEVLGDRKPTQLLRHMRKLLGDRVLEESILRQLFLQRLPANVQMVLASTGDSVKLEQLAELADKMMDVSFHQPPTVATVSAAPKAQPPPAPQTELELLRKEISQLSLHVAALSRRPRHRTRSRTRSRSQTPTPTANDNAAADRSRWCWYHASFGEKARKCNPPCEYPGNATASN